MLSYKLIVAAACITGSLAQQTAWGQCGGEGWTGPTTCVSGYCCTVSNQWYSQCTAGTCGGTGNPPTEPEQPSLESYTNPVLWEDLADNDVFRVGDAFYYTSSTMHYSPGAPVLESYDLVNWQYIGHAVPTLAWGTKYDLASGQRAYVKGIWASTMRYRKSNNLWYWIGCIEFGKTYVYTASSPSGPWTQRSIINTCYYDAGLLIDDNDTMYVAYGNSQISVAQLSADGFSQVRTQQVYTTPSSIGTLEGARFYKRSGQYYIFLTRPANGQYIIKSSSPFGSYAIKQLALNMPSPVGGSGYPHQGSLVDTASGSWYYMAFIDAYPGGRVPVLAPVTWGSDGFPTITTVNGGWGSSYPYPVTPRQVTPTTGTDRFTTSSLSHLWEWNHNPDTSKFSTGAGLKLSTATVTVDIYAARNTLTRRIHGGQGTGTLELDFTNLADGDRAGLALWRDQSAWIGVSRDGSAITIRYVNGITMNSDWTTQNTGATAASVAISTRKVWLRIKADIRPGGTNTAQFFYSTDGNSFTQLGGSFTMNKNWQFFMGYRYGIFNYATKALGGSVLVNSFTSV